MGHLTGIKLNGTTSIWKLNAVNVMGQPTNVTTGSFNRTYGYSAYGFPTSRTAGSFQNFTYTFDASKGNLTNRKDNSRNKQEDFAYDNLNRLTAYAGKTAGYDTKGNVMGRSDVGSFVYNTSGKPYAISGVASPSSAIPLRNQTVTYNALKRPASLSEAIYAATFTYNGSGERVKMALTKNGSKELNRYYISDCYEIDDPAIGGIKEKLYLGGDFYTAPAVYVKEGAGAWQVYSICRDYLGSITHITNSSGSVTQELSYDAWGRLRNPADQTAYTPGNEPGLFLGRGYTGHEHLTQFGLINMNARLYDPAVGRFLAPDPYVQNALFSQSFNRYSYALNNPLRYTDPSGEEWWHWLLADMLTGGLISSTIITTGVATYPAIFPFTNQGYEVQKYISPIAFKPNISFGNIQNGIGFDVSIGMLKGSSSYRYHFGASYYFSSYGDYSGWETRSGYEWEIIPFLSYSGTKFKAGEFTQTTNVITIGDPFNGIIYENDMVPEGIFNKIPLVPKGDGDRWRTAAVQLYSGVLTTNLNMFTGDAGPDRSADGNHKMINGHDTYIANNGYDPNKYRAGVLSFGIGPFRIGRNSEGIRKVFQNQFAHDLLTGGKSLWFEVLPIKSSWYFYFGTGTGGTLW
ncbi:MAG: hypothetical protein LBR10_13180 [Prevotellaceae bacterium]|nr:hypothetical protein [Prevotellaceae bacterium]